MKLELYYFSKPYTITQAWGIFNPAYQQFGFSRHNGIDSLPGNDSKIYSPIKMRIYNSEYNANGAGNFVRGITTEQWNVNGQDCFVELTFMHLKESLCKVGDILGVGVLIGVADNTGFSTGPHTHLRCVRLKSDLSLMDSNDANNSFDHASFYNGYFAGDANQVKAILNQILELLKGFWSKLNKPIINKNLL